MGAIPEHQMVAGDVVYDYGRIVVSSGLLEYRVASIAEIYLVPDVRDHQFSTLIRELKRRVQYWGVPEWARCRPADVRQFCVKADKAMARRNEIFHASHYGIVTEKREPLTVRAHIRTGKVAKKDSTEVHEFVARLDNLVERGHYLERDLMHLIRPDGVYSRDRDSPSGMPIVIQDAGYNLAMTRITDEEANAYWDEYYATPRAPWPPNHPLNVMEVPSSTDSQPSPPLT